jgi:hypothetical protein
VEFIGECDITDSRMAGLGEDVRNQRDSNAEVQRDTPSRGPASHVALEADDDASDSAGAELLFFLSP